MSENELKQTINDLVIEGKGILAADESISTAEKRLESIEVISSEENRRRYRNMILNCGGMEKYISGVILFEETLIQKSNDDVLFPKLLEDKGIVPGIKVDKGLKDFKNSSEKHTTGLSDLKERLLDYKKLGARFAKWRVIFEISEVNKTPSNEIIEENCESLAKYAKICQSVGVVPIVEPEILYDGVHNINECEEVSSKVFSSVFKKLENENVDLSLIILKPSMVINGKDSEIKASNQEIALRTVNVLKKTVPKQVPSINFLSGGQTPIQATINLNEINKLRPFDWLVSFSYGRGLQKNALKKWMGDDSNLGEAQRTFLESAKNNHLAVLGRF